MSYVFVQSACKFGTYFKKKILWGFSKALVQNFKKIFNQEKICCIRTEKTNIAAVFTTLQTGQRIKKRQGLFGFNYELCTR